MRKEKKIKKHKKTIIYLREKGEKRKRQKRKMEKEKRGEKKKEKRKDQEKRKEK